MHCPSCFSTNLTTGITRDVPEQNLTIRSRVCNQCGKQILTQEYLHVKAVRILERDGSRPYLRPKYLHTQLLDLLRTDTGDKTETDLYSYIDNACRKLFYKRKKHLSRNDVDKIIIEELKDKYPLLCIAYYLKYAILSKSETPKFIKKLLKIYEDENTEESVKQRKRDRDKVYRDKARLKKQASLDTHLNNTSSGESNIETSSIP